MTALKESNLSENETACIRKKPSIPVALRQVLRKCMGLGFFNFFKNFLRRSGETSSFFFENIVFLENLPIFKKMIPMESPLDPICACKNPRL